MKNRPGFPERLGLDEFDDSPRYLLCTGTGRAQALSGLTGCLKAGYYGATVLLRRKRLRRARLTPEGACRPIHSPRTVWPMEDTWDGRRNGEDAPEPEHRD